MVIRLKHFQIMEQGVMHNMKNLLYITPFLCLTFVGCSQQSSNPDIRSLEVHAGYAGTKTEVSVVEPDRKKHKREDCPYKPDGKIVHGDGHFSFCPDCEPPRERVSEASPVTHSEDSPPKIEKQPPAPTTQPPQVQPQRKYYINRRGQYIYYD